MSSRSAVAQHVAEVMMSGGDRNKAITEAAAWLMTHGKARQVSYLANDIAQALADKGYLFARVTTARPITESTKQQITQFIKTETQAQTVECEYFIDESLIGGALIATPYGTLDASVKAALSTIIEGASQ